MGNISYEQMVMFQSMPLEQKIKFTETKVRAWYLHYHGNVYVSYSGGKDSTVLLDIVKRIFPDVPAVFCDTGLEYPEVRELAIKKADVVLKPKMNFKQVIEKYGYPFPSKEQSLFIRQAKYSTEHMKEVRLGDGRYSVSKKWRFLLDAPFNVSEQCCDVMKKRPFKLYEKKTGRVKITGMLATESSKRQLRYMKYGCNSFSEKNPSSMPLAIWNEQDILNYLIKFNIEYASCYGDIILNEHGKLVCTKEDRTGCMFCMFGIQYDKTPNRFQRMKENYPSQYKYCIEKLGIGEVLDYVGIPYE